MSGERLIEVKIAQTLDVSQNTVREALRILEQEGWVVKQPRRGVYVRSFSAAAAVEVYALVDAVEALALVWAVEKIDKAMRADLEALLVMARKYADIGERPQAFEQLLQFHERIGAAAQKPLTAQMLETLYNQMRLLEALRQARAPRTPRELEAQIKAHEALYLAIEAGDAESACRRLRGQIAAYSATTIAALKL